MEITKNNKNEILLPDGETVGCQLYMQDDPPKFWTRCTNNANESLPMASYEAFKVWEKEHPKHTIMLHPAANYCWLCTNHYNVVIETL